MPSEGRTRLPPFGYTREEVISESAWNAGFEVGIAEGERRAAEAIARWHEQEAKEYEAAAEQAPTLNHRWSHKVLAGLHLRSAAEIRAGRWKPTGEEPNDG